MVIKRVSFYKKVEQTAKDQKLANRLGVFDQKKKDYSNGEKIGQQLILTAITS